MDKTKHVSRRKMLSQSGAILGSIVLIPLATQAPPARAGSVNKGMLHYQETPKDGKMCADCAAYTPPATPDSGTGTCKVVSGPVNPQGWCMAYSHR